MKIPFVIAATARCTYSDSYVFNNNKIVYNETFRLIQNFKLIIVYKSQALF